MNENSVPTLKDIAEAAGVSVASVSKVLNNRAGVGDESRRKILENAEKLGYQVRSLRSLIRAGVDNAVVVTPTEFYSRSTFYEDIIRGLLEEASANSLKLDVRLISIETGHALAEIEEILRDLRPGAFIGLGMDQPDVIKRLVAAGIPAVIINGIDRTMQLSSVLPDNWAAGWLATQRLLSANHRNIVHVTRPHRLSLRRRLDGFRVALTEAGITFDYDAHVLDLEKLGADASDTPQVMRQALQSGRFSDTTAFFCSTDVIGIGVMQALQSRGFSIPDDRAVIAVDDISIAQHSTPPLTTVRIDRAELGRVGIQLLLERINDPETSVRSINMGVRLIERGSVSNAP